MVTCLGFVLGLLLAAPVERSFGFDAAGPLTDGWLTARGRWTVADGVLVQTDLATPGAYAWLTDTAFSHCDVSVRFRAAEAGAGVRAAGLVFRARDGRHGYYVHFDSRNQQVIVVRQTAAKPWHELARVRGVDLAPAGWHTGRVTARGTRIDVFVDGRSVATAEDDAFPVGYVGVRAGQGRIEFDDFRVTGEPAEAPPFTVPEDPMDVSQLPRLAARQDSPAVLGQGYFPVLVTLADGSLGAAVRGGAPHIGRAGRLDWIRSTDGGATWSAPTVIVDSEWDDRNPAVGVMANGDVVVAYSEARSYNDQGQFDHKAGIFALRYVVSKDAGATWSAARPLAPEHYDQGSPYGRILVLPDGTALMPLYHFPRRDGQPNQGTMTSQGKQACSLLRSTDHGQTWGDPSLVHDEFNEFSVDRLGDGRILAALRHVNGSVWTSESSDAGRTWSAPAQLTPTTQHPADLLALDGDTVLLATGCRTGPYGVITWLSDDGGRTFDPATRVLVADDAMNGDCGYASLQRLADGTLVMLWYAVGTAEQEGAQARCVRFTEADLRAAARR